MILLLFPSEPNSALSCVKSCEESFVPFSQLQELFKGLNSGQFPTPPPNEEHFVFHPSLSHRGFMYVLWGCQVLLPLPQQAKILSCRKGEWGRALCLFCCGSCSGLPACTTAASFLWASALPLICVMHMTEVRGEEPV